MYVILSERTYGSKLEDYIAKVDWATGTYEKIYNLGEDGREDFVGAEDGYVFLRKFEGYSSNYDSMKGRPLIYKVAKISITNVIDDSKIFSYEIYNDRIGTEWYIYSGKLVSLGNHPNNVLEINVVDFEDSDYQRIEGPTIASLNFSNLNDINFYEEAILLEPNWTYNQDGIIGVYEEDATTWGSKVIIPEKSAGNLSVAMDRLYYESYSDLGHIYCYLDFKEDGELVWHELNYEDFESPGMSLPSY